jgi:hypothetical protein
LEILGRNRSTLDALASALLSAGYLDQAEITAVLAQTPLCPQAITDVASRLPKQFDRVHGKTDAGIVSTPTPTPTSTV